MRYKVSFFRVYKSILKFSINSTSYYNEDIEWIDEENNTKIKAIDKRNKLYKYSFRHERNIKTDEWEVINNTIEPTYSRPLSYNNLYSRKALIYLNLSLPTNELIDFIKQFKREYDKDQTIVKNILKVLNIEAEETIKDINLPSIQNRYADMFFIYDCRKLGYTQQEIIIKIYNYYHDLNPTTTTTAFTPKRIKKYHEIATKYIDNEEYKHLVT